MRGFFHLLLCSSASAGYEATLRAPLRVQGKCGASADNVGPLIAPRAPPWRRGQVRDPSAKTCSRAADNLGRFYQHRRRTQAYS
ncbi:hypothetical protein Micbo1qcDRAFT_62834 [Microdochium bolleyi]|uniref:Secreted protein n=1 Tax=Microdochium bolleyi TaxID=196109 RepID=A0A136IJE7_9PEZI|nr:hypothetical protein Micbo1qcDRAFT_62834 [Microdochium bolleyi]